MSKVAKTRQETKFEDNRFFFESPAWKLEVAVDWGPPDLAPSPIPRADFCWIRIVILKSRRLQNATEIV